MTDSFVEQTVEDFREAARKTDGLTVRDDGTIELFPWMRE